MKRRFTTLVAALVAACSLIGVAGCGQRRIELPKEVPAAVEGADKDVRAGAMYALGLIESLGYVAKAAQAVEIKFFNEAKFPAAAHQAIQQGFLEVANAARKANGEIKDGVLTWAQLKARIDPLLTTVQGLLDMFQQAGGGLKAALGSLWDFLKDVGLGLLAGVGEGRIGGGRDLQPLEVIQ